MNFLSFDWFAWMAGAVAVYWLLPPSWRDRGLAFMTLGFLAFYAPASAIYLILFTLASYYFTRVDPVPGWRVGGVAALIVVVLVHYKLRVAADSGDVVDDVLIPLGLSYYSFRCLHYLIERWRGGLPRHDLGDLVCYLFFLPTIVVGPIHRFEPFRRDLHRKRWDASMLSEGMERILYGYVKIAVLGNFLVSAKIAGWIVALGPEHVALATYLDMVRRGLNIYFQFSGFSDIAIGFALMLGYRVMENFNWPYLQTNISAFWRSWHISLSSWCRDYIYTVVLSFTRSPALGALATLLVIGLWHELSFRYLAWGAWHAAGLIVWQQFQRIKPMLPTIGHPLARGAVHALSLLLTVHFVWFSFVLVSQPDFAAAGRVYATILFSWWN